MIRFEIRSARCCPHAGHKLRCSSRSMNENIGLTQQRMSSSSSFTGEGTEQYSLVSGIAFSAQIVCLKWTESCRLFVTGESMSEELTKSHSSAHGMLYYWGLPLYIDSRNSKWFISISAWRGWKYQQKEWNRWTIRYLCVTCGDVSTTRVQKNGHG